MGNRPPDSEVRAALQAYFRVLQSNPTAEEMRRSVVTDDFETGFAAGYKWQGPNGLRDFLAARAGFADEQHDVDEVLERKDLPSGGADQDPPEVLVAPAARRRALHGYRVSHLAIASRRHWAVEGRRADRRRFCRPQ